MKNKIGDIYVAIDSYYEGASIDDNWIGKIIKGSNLAKTIHCDIGGLGEYWRMNSHFMKLNEAVAKGFYTKERLNETIEERFVEEFQELDF